LKFLSIAQDATNTPSTKKQSKQKQKICEIM